jgi:hypothetical protein
VCESGRVHTSALGKRFLNEIPEGTLTDDDAAGGGVFAAEHLEQTGLASPVSPDEAHLVAGAHGEGRLNKGETPCDLHAQVTGLQHPTIMAVNPSLPETSYRPFRAAS